MMSNYGYRADGLRAWKQDAAGNRTFFYYEGGQLLAVQNQADASTRATVMLWGADGLIGYRWTDAGGVNRSRYHLYDVQGNLAQALDEAGNVVETAGVTAHGMPLVNGSAFGVSSAFAYGAKFGYYRDGESGFYLCGFRYYDPSAGRWITRDPIGFAGGANLYGYVENDTVNGVDPFGLQYEPSDPPARLHGPWTQSDLARGLRGRPPLDFGGRVDLHHAGQMPGSGVHEILQQQHQSQSPALHPNKYNQGVTPRMRCEDRELHWYMRSREMGPVEGTTTSISSRFVEGINIIAGPLVILDFIIHYREWERLAGSPATWEEVKAECPTCVT